VKAWRDAWERFIPFLEFAPEVRRIIYTTNAIESLNYQLRKIIKNRGHFPSDDAVIKLLWLAIRDIEDKRGPRPSQRSRPTQRPTPQRRTQTRRRSRRPTLEPSPRSAHHRLRRTTHPTHELKPHLHRKLDKL
jgi:transposase-like protein